MRRSEPEPQLRAAVERGVAVYVITKTLQDRGKRDAPEYRRLEQALTDWGVVMVHKRGMHEKLVFVDDDVLWCGSLNPLSYSGTQEVMERRHSKRVVDDFAQTLRLEELIGAYDDGAPACPICGEELVASEGKDDPYYWRCIQDDCYRRGIDQPPLTDGKITCTNCGGDVAWGSWGDRPAWRCTKNARHRQWVSPTHLRLPKMRALVPTGDLRRISRQFEMAAGERLLA